MRNTLVVMSVVLGLALSSMGCDAQVTCDKFDAYVSDCSLDCMGGSWDCIAQYNSVSADEQRLLDACSDCLGGSFCDEDCTAEGMSCFEILALYLGMDGCW